MASHTDPSLTSPSPIRQKNAVLARFSKYLLAYAIPAVLHRPCPSEPVPTSTHGNRGVGCPSKSLSIFLSVSNYSRDTIPASAHAASTESPSLTENRSRVSFTENELIIGETLRIS